MSKLSKHFLKTIWSGESILFQFFVIFPNNEPLKNPPFPEVIDQIASVWKVTHSSATAMMTSLILLTDKITDFGFSEI